ncbi:MAG: 4-carboxy-4-hydroxy-2-oxoadipate aldolase/oxaloacetate decarboxylase [Streptosporangiales bacterium]|nr:4-carboxy-4-hydroxy-2-oxoadipate aldolase/oxaloacetate decarboxylase [Streptosporangiales bacterium]MBO0890441.1 4-carboxy-4-hydroxy-2-oxoadipate aldolase/oxaloacetate decarboxylase [Acidothermales bacterium]
MSDAVVVTDIERAPADLVDRLGGYGVATVHEALDRVGYLGPRFRPVHPASIAGPAVTALCWPGDNLMIHAAVEQCRPGDVLVVTTTSPSTDGMFGELLATSLQARGVRGAVIDAGARDVAELREMGFPVWSTAVSAQGTVKSTAGSVNVPVVLGGQRVCPGDAVVADEDGVLCVPRADVARAIEGARARVENEAASREAFRAGELGLDRYGMREKLAGLGVRYLSAAEYARERRS